MKKKFLRAGAMLLLPLLLIAALSSCATKPPPPKLEDVKDELIARIDASFAVNEIFWGKGLPVYETTEPLDWVMIRADAPCRTVGEIKTLAEGAYARSYLEGNVYTPQFDGLYDSVHVQGIAPHYREDSTGFYRNMNFLSRPIGEPPTYDYGTMTIRPKISSGERIYVEVTATTAEGTETRTLSFDKQEDGWFLSSPTY